MQNSAPLAQDLNTITLISAHDLLYCSGIHRQMNGFALRLP